MSSCYFCENPPEAELWWKWQEAPDEARDLVDSEKIKDLQLHMEKHRSPQPRRPGPWRARQYEKAARKLSQRQKNILRLLRGGGGLSAAQLTSFLFAEPQKSEHSKVGQDLRILLRSQFVYRLFLEHLPGEGPRPPKTPALYFLGKSARVVLETPIQKRKDWFEEIGDFQSWNGPYETWRKNERASLVASSFGEARPQGLRTRGLRLTVSDPLLGKITVEPESRILARYQEETFSLFLFNENHLRDPQDELERVLRFSALQRNGSAGKLSLALLPVESAARGKALLEVGSSRTLPRKTLILLSPLEEIQSANPSWRSLVHNQSAQLEQFFQILLGKKERSEAQ